MSLFRFFGEDSESYEFPENGEEDSELSDLVGAYVDAYVRENPDASAKDVAVEMGRFAFTAGRAYQADVESDVTLRISADAAANLIARLLQEEE